MYELSLNKNGGELGYELKAKTMTKKIIRLHENDKEIECLYNSLAEVIDDFTGRTEIKTASVVGVLEILKSQVIND